MIFYQCCFIGDGILKDVSRWFERSFGGDGSLPMKVLVSPEDSTYYMKFGWKSKQKRTHLEHINEVVAAKIAELLQLDVIQAEVALRDGKYGCLSLDFVEQYNATEEEAGAVLMEAELDVKYSDLQSSPLKGWDLLELGFSTIEEFTYFNKIRQPFIAMNLFDILIGNQDRHPSNWVILFKDGESFFGPLFDNGASLGFLLPDEELERMLANDGALERYYDKMRVKAGIFSSGNPPIKATDLIEYCILNYKEEVKLFKEALLEFSFEKYELFVDCFSFYSNIRKEFVKRFIEHRRDKLISLMKEGL